MSRMCRVQVAAVAVLAAGVAGSGSTNAVAAEPPPPSNSGIGQYVEQVPSSGGSKAPGVSKSKKTKLPKNVATKIRRSGGTDAPLLEKVATSSDLGAPQQTQAKTKAKRTARDTAKPAQDSRAVPKASRGADATRAPAVAAAADTGSGGGSSHAPLLVALAIVVASTVAFGAWYAARRRGAGPPASR